jgi:hypothetical protein
LKVNTIALYDLAVKGYDVSFFAGKLAEYNPETIVD